MSQADSGSTRIAASAAVVGIVATAMVTLSAAGASAATTHSTSPKSHRPDHARTVLVTRKLSVSDRGDSYVSFRRPSYKPGFAPKLVATNDRHDRKIAFVKFDVSGLPRGAEVTRAVVTLHRDSHHLPASTVRLRRVSNAAWSQSRIDAHHAPHVGAVVASRHVNSHDSVVRFSVRRLVRHNGSYALAIRSTSHHGVARFQSREAGQGPSLALTYRVARLLAGNPTPVPAPTTTPTAAPIPTPTVTPTSVPTPTPTDTPTAVPTPTPTVTPTSVPTPTPTVTPTTPPTQSSCKLSSSMVPSCGVLFGGAMDSFGGDTIDKQYSNFNQGSGTHMVLMHDYRRPGQTLSPYDVKLVNTPGAILQLNWKPTGTWSSAAGGNATVNSQIDNMAKSIKALGNHKIFLSVYHEPENDVSGGAAGCASNIYKGHAGTPADYRAMWANVEDRFNALGVSNVVWVMNYMNWGVWDCMIDDMWPGNNLVDWVFYESYSNGNYTYDYETGRFYNVLTAKSDAAHDYLSKPWGIGEFGNSQLSRADQEKYLTDISSDLTGHVYPKLKLLSAFDAYMEGNDFRVRYDHGSAVDNTELANFVSLANNPAILAGNQSVANSQG